MSLRTMFQTDMIPFVFPELNLTGVDTHTQDPKTSEMIIITRN